MRLKIFFGIILPLLIIISITILGSVGPGFNISEDFEDSISSNEIFKKDYNNNAIRIGEIKISNDYFLPKRYEAQDFLVCAFDSENKRPLNNVGAVFYNEGEFSEEIRIADISKVQYASSSYRYYNGYNNYKTNIELDAGESKTLQMYFSSNRYYYDYGNDENRDYDKLLIVPQNENKKLTCESLSSENIKDSIKINIFFPLNYCTDSDTNSANDYYTIRNKLSFFGSCTDNRNVTYNDFCSDDKTIEEYNCSPKGDGESCSTTSYDCTSYGFTSCSYGYCI